MCVVLQVAGFIGTIKVSGKRLLNLINDILDAAKMKQGKLVVKHDKVGRGAGGLGFWMKQSEACTLEPKP